MNEESTSPTQDVSNVGCAGKRFLKCEILFRQLYLLFLFSAGQRPYQNQNATYSLLPHIHVTDQCTSAWAEVYNSQKHIDLLASGTLDRVVW